MNTRSVLFAASLVLHAILSMATAQPSKDLVEQLEQTQQPTFFKMMCELADDSRRRQALKAFDVLVLADGGDLSLMPNARKLAVDAFGEDFVRDWESSDGVVRDQLSGMRFNEFVMRRDGDDDVDGLMRYRELSGNRDVLSEVEMWRDYAGKRHAQLEKVGILQAYAKEQEKVQKLNREAEQKRLREQQLQELTRGIIYGACILLLLYPAYKLFHIIITYRNGKHLPSVACIILLMLAMLHMPHGYYTFLRLSVCTWGASEAFRTKVPTTRVATVGIALLYNPFVEVQLAKSEWLIINLLTALGILSAIAYSIYQHRKRENPNTPA